jgi:protein O-GlcNAc transferase
VGKTMVARMAGSLVKAAGLPQLLTYSVDEYVDRAIFFANNPQEVKSMSKHLIENRLNLPLFDTEKFVTYLEKAYVQMAQMTWSGQDLLAIKLESQ